MSIGPDDHPSARLVRQHRFDLLVAPADAAGIGHHLRAQGLAGGGLKAYQFNRRPRSEFRLPGDMRVGAKALKAQGVDLVIDLPHDGEVAVVHSPAEDIINAFGRRLT